MDTKERTKVMKFVNYWQNLGDEKQHTQSFWNGLFQNVLGVEDPTGFLEFEKRVKLENGNTGFIDAYVPATNVLIEQKGKNIDLDTPKEQSDGSMLTPYQQALRYNKELPYPHARWIVVSNFKEFRVYDMKKEGKERDKPVTVLTLNDLEKESYALNFLINENQRQIIRETQISVKAGLLVGKIYQALKKQYKGELTDADYQSLNKLCVRIVFCLYAEDSGLFGTRLQFHDYLEQEQKGGCAKVRKALIDLFKILDTPPEKRDPYGDESLNAFPYVNGGLFEDENLIIPQFSNEIVETLIDKASAGFDWSEISPTIFGAVFESTLESKTRRSSGMHYTSIENIRKVINPLFMDELNAEFEKIVSIAERRTRNKKLEQLQQKLGTLKFLDPACGSGNFLTETYLQLRRLENKILKILTQGQMSLGTDYSPIQVHINQFYGIEINDFAVTVAKTALWIAESQMMKETEDIVQTDLDFLPLKSSANIYEGNALRLDWDTLVPANQLSYIMGNPPFVGYSYQSKEQKKDLQIVYPQAKSSIDYVSGWYFKTAKFLNENYSNARCAFVSTNSIAQGEHVVNVWKPLITEFGMKIQFAYQTFKWDSDSTNVAGVHVVIIGFGRQELKSKLLYSGNTVKTVSTINAYLTEGDNVFIDRRTNPLCPVSPIHLGSMPRDDGYLLLSEEEKDIFIKENPNLKTYIRPYMMGKDFLVRKPRYCLWLTNANASDLRSKAIKERLEKVKEFRLSSNRKATYEAADTPFLFGEIRDSKSDFYVAFPKVSSENRKYVPMDFLSKNIIAGDKLFMVENASKYEFGILHSLVHMAWLKAVGGRLEMRFSYSSTIIYNNFVWPNPTPEQKKKIEQTAQNILDVRSNEKNKDSSLSDLYDPLAMPLDLKKAHEANDKAVMEAYGFNNKMTESEIVGELFKLFNNKINELEKIEEEKTEKEQKQKDKNKSKVKTKEVNKSVAKNKAN